MKITTTPRTGSELYRWLIARGADTYDRAKRLGRARLYSGWIKLWTPEQVADVWHELQKPAKGSQRWGDDNGQRTTDNGQPR